MASVKQIVGVILISAVLLTGIAYWFDKSNQPNEPLLSEEIELNDPFETEELQIYNDDITNTMNPIAVFQTNKGVFEIELYEDLMPITVGNFTKLAEEKYYDGQKFHRVMNEFMIQGGDPNTKGEDVKTYGMGGPGYTIQDEFIDNPLLKNTRGTIAMANTGQPDSGGSQFFINLSDNNQFLDFDKEPFTSKHPVFGRVVKGMEIVDDIAGVETEISPTTGEPSLPVDPIIIQSVTINRGS